ncbi:di-heme oxidoredictase family protein [Chryseolinea soli]|uniref:di-heme oxidoreductase family protein n=1 Tax=Chryseolinea soli TaxID=2321403 RepID=UPI001E63C4B3|nr:di-heme oxidoredictase family protein [Chryseolinea soli]
MRKDKIFIQVLMVVGVIVSIYSCVEPDALNDSDYSEWLSGGSQTVFDNGAGGFSTAFPHLTAAREKVHSIGDGAFGQTFVTAPAPQNPGLGPIFNNVSCTSCHINDGRGKPPLPGEQLSSLLIRISIPGTDAHGGPNPVPGFGGQLQQRGVFGAQPEASVRIDYTEQSYTFADGTPYSLRFPTYTLENPYTTLPAGVMLSPRVAPPVFGLGLLEAVDEADILALADPDDRNDDGISGKPNYAWNVAEGKMTLGKFGWKAANPSLLQQSAGAYNEDMGITNFVFPHESATGQPQYDGRDDEYEVSDSLLYSVAFYIRTLGVPARRAADDAGVLQGKKLFTDGKCSQCHVPRLRTKTDVAFPEISNQVIFPYTDMLVHDMGPNLADNRPDFDASGVEWRTSPLWGIGLTRIVNGHQNFLHDGRARTLLEAIMWHGGEAEASKEFVRTLSQDDRDKLIKFLESL